MYKCIEGDTISVNLDPITSTAFKTGVAFVNDEAPLYLGPFINHSLTFAKESNQYPNDIQETVITDAFGHYELDFLDIDWVYAKGRGDCDEEGGCCVGYTTNTVKPNAHYQDLFFHGSEACVGKPNIYLYPQETIDLDVAISFPISGEVTLSDPYYDDEWHVTVEPDGTIDNEYTFLFYESVVPDKFQKERGWVVADSDLETFFSDNLYKTGIRGQELQDFMDWWMPKWKGMSKYYAVYPQYNKEIDPLIEITFSTPLDNFIRLFYIVDAIDNPEDVALETPKIPAFKREGFFGVEWGVVDGNMGIDPSIQ